MPADATILGPDDRPSYWLNQAWLALVEKRDPTPLAREFVRVVDATHRGWAAPVLYD